MAQEEPTTPAQVLVLPSAPPLPSGWGELLQETIAREDEEEADDLRSWHTSQLVPAMIDQSRAIQPLVRRRQWAQAAARAKDLHRLALQLVHRVYNRIPAPSPDILHKALRMEVLAVSLQQSCEGENPGRARFYARDILSILEDVRQPLLADPLDQLPEEPSPPSSPPEVDNP